MNVISPLPWRLAEGAEAPLGAEPLCEIRDAEDDLVAECVAEEDAELIVSLCNASAGIETFVRGILALLSPTCGHAPSSPNADCLACAARALRDNLYKVHR